MRLDKFLKVTQMIKRRTVAKETVEEGVIFVNGKKAKPSFMLSVGDIIEIDMWNYYKKAEVLKIPDSGSVAKSRIDEYIRVTEFYTK